MKKNPTFVLNWKMNLLPGQELELCHKLTQFLCNYTKLIICPSFLTLLSCGQMIEGAKSTISLGSQDCSEHDLDNFTSQICAKSLFEIGCRYGIVGHRETRLACAFSEQNILSKTKMALKEGLTPIICLGTNPEELESQIECYFDFLHENKEKQIIFAYEPVLEIGSSKSAELEVIKTATTQIRHLLGKYSNKISILYGGNVSAQNIVKIWELGSLDGFLIGKAGLNFQEIKKMIESLS